MNKNACTHKTRSSQMRTNACEIRKALDVVRCDKSLVVRAAAENVKRRLDDVRFERLNARGLAEFHAIHAELRLSMSVYEMVQPTHDEEMETRAGRIVGIGWAGLIIGACGLVLGGILLPISLVYGVLSMVCGLSITAVIMLCLKKAARTLAFKAWAPTVEACAVIGLPETPDAGPCGLYLRADSLVFAVLGPLESIVEEQRVRRCEPDLFESLRGESDRAIEIFTGAEARYAGLQPKARRLSLSRDFSAPLTSR